MAVAANQRLMAQTNFWRSILSARAPAGSVKRKKASDATVDMSDMKSGDSLSIFIDQVAALSWAATQVPEITVASQSFLKTGFLRAVQVEPLVIIKSPSVTNESGSQSSRIFANSFCWPGAAAKDRLACSIRPLDSRAHLQWCRNPVALRSSSVPL